MQATVQIAADGMVIANLDSDDYAADEDDRALMNLRADDMLDQSALWRAVRMHHLSVPSSTPAAARPVRAPPNGASHAEHNHDGCLERPDLWRLRHALAW